MKKTKYLFLPTATNNLASDAKSTKEAVEGEINNAFVPDSPCPCCKYITIPNHGDAPSYICPVCLWEIDSFIQSENEPSDQNHGLTLAQARQNYAVFGAVLPRLKKHSKAPTDL